MKSLVLLIRIEKHLHYPEIGCMMETSIDTMSLTIAFSVLRFGTRVEKTTISIMQRPDT